MNYYITGFSAYHLDMKNFISKKNLQKICFYIITVFFSLYFYISSLILEGVKPQSTCELEVDAVAADILNRLDIEGIYTVILNICFYS